MNYSEFATKKLTDAGTRYEHLHDLLAAWEEGLEVMQRYSYLGEHDKKKQMKLAVAIDLLRNTLDGMTGYPEAVHDLRLLVEAVPRDPTSIRGGRGTELAEQYGSFGF